MVEVNPENFVFSKSYRNGIYTYAYLCEPWFLAKSGTMNGFRGWKRVDDYHGYPGTARRSLFRWKHYEYSAEERNQRCPIFDRFAAQDPFAAVAKGFLWAMMQGYRVAAMPINSYQWTLDCDPLVQPLGEVNWSYRSEVDWDFEGDREFPEKRQLIFDFSSRLKEGLFRVQRFEDILCAFFAMNSDNSSELSCYCFKEEDKLQAILPILRQKQKPALRDILGAEDFYMVAYQDNDAHDMWGGDLIAIQSKNDMMEKISHMRDRFVERIYYWNQLSNETAWTTQEYIVHMQKLAGI